MSNRTRRLDGVEARSHRLRTQAPKPEQLVEEAAAALAPGGVWLLGDMAARDGVRENVEHCVEINQ